MQTSWWAKFMESLGWGHFGVVVREDDTIFGGAQVLRNIYSPGYCYYYIPEGPALPSDTDDGAQVYQYIMAYIEKTRQNDPNVVSHLCIEPRWEQLPSYITGFQAAKSWMEPRNTLCIDLTISEDDILAQMKPKGRYNIGLARRYGVTVVEDSSPKGVEDFLRLYSDTVTRQNIRGKRQTYFYTLIPMLKEFNIGSIFFAEYAGARIATVLTIQFGHRATYFYGGSTDQHREVMAPYLLHFEIMLRMKARGCECYDLYGIAPINQPEHKWTNLSTFKRKLGGKDFQFVPALHYIYDSEAYEKYKKIKANKSHDILG
jgi:lipid II:glycine glycyltransferase (peptidoglycan interpeptide bridge formation enzyme)